MIPRLYYQIAVSICLCMVPVCLWGSDDTPVYYGSTIVEDTLLPELQLRDLSAFVTIINTGDLIGTYQNVSEVLDEVAGVKIKRFGGAGNFSTISIRGSTAEQVMVYLDGILLNASSGGAVDLSSIPLENIDHIEVFRGMSPAALGAASLGGVVNIVTRQGKTGGVTSMKAGWGSFDTGLFNVHHARPAGPGKYLLNLDLQGSRGNFTFLDDNGTSFNTNDDEYTKRKNNSFYSASLLTRYGFHLKNKTGMEFSNLFFIKDQGIPGVGNFQSGSASLDTVREMFAIRFFLPDLPEHGSSLKTTLFVNYLEQSFTDEKGEIGVGVQDNRNHTLSLGGNARYLYSGWHRNMVMLFTEIRRESFTPYDEYLEPAEGSTSTRVSAVMSAEDVIGIIPGTWEINPSIRLDLYSTNTDNPDLFLHLPADQYANSKDWFVSGKIGTKFHVSDNFSIQANIGRFNRLPDFAELYGNRGYIIGTPFLEPEHSTNIDLGFQYRTDHFRGFRNITLQTGYFMHKAENLIQYIQNSQGTAKAENLESALIQGMELEMETVTPGQFYLSANYTLQLSRDTSNVISRKDNRLPNNPVHELNLKIRRGLRKTQLEYRFEYISSNYLDRANLQEVPQRFLHGIAWKIPLKKRVHMTVDGKNLTNNQVQDYRGYPLPGRSFSVSFEMRL